jgi:hypothetical protein
VADRVHRGVEHQVGDGVGHRGDSAGERAEQDDEQGDADAEPEEGPVEQDAVPAVGREVARVAPHLQLVPGDLAVEAHVAELDGEEALDQRGVGVALDVGVGVVLAVDGHPLARADPRRDPRGDPQDEREPRGEGHGAVAEASVEVHGRDERRHLGDGEADDEAEQEGGELHVATLPTCR